MTTYDFRKSFNFVVTLIHMHILVFLGQNICSAFVTEFRHSHPSCRCPYTATKAFIGRQTSFISNALKLNPIPSTLSSPYVSPMIGASQALLFLTSRDILLNFDVEKVKRQRQFDTRLFSTAKSVDFEELAVSAVSPSDSIPIETQPKKTKTKSSSGSEPLEVLVIGLSHHNADLSVREKLAIPEDQWNEAASALCEYPSIREASILSTCNRFELYLAGPNQHECIRDAVDFLEKRAGGSLDHSCLRKNLFMLSGEDAIWHLLRVAAGLDSMVIGEGQILSQVKKSYSHGLEETGKTGKVLSRMLNTAVTAGKRVRTETGISRGAVSISSAAAEFTASRLPEDCQLASLSEANVAIIGAGEMARLLLVHLQTQGVTAITIVNRSPDRVLELQKEFPALNIRFETMDKLWEVVAVSDVVYPSTASQTTIIDPIPLAASLKSRRRPGGIHMVDISVPRNVHPGCDDLPGVSSYNVDHLKAVVGANTAKRRREMILAEDILKEELVKFRSWQQSQTAIPTIAKLQEKAEGIRAEEVGKVSRKLSHLAPKDIEAVERLSKSVVAKLLHGPLQHLRQQGGDSVTDGNNNNNNQAEASSSNSRVVIEQIQQAFQLDSSFIF